MSVSYLVRFINFKLSSPEADRCSRTTQDNLLHILKPICICWCFWGQDGVSKNDVQCSFSANIDVCTYSDLWCIRIWTGLRPRIRLPIRISQQRRQYLVFASVLRPRPLFLLIEITSIFEITSVLSFNFSTHIYLWCCVNRLLLHCLLTEVVQTHQTGRDKLIKWRLSFLSIPPPFVTSSRRTLFLFSLCWSYSVFEWPKSNLFEWSFDWCIKIVSVIVVLK